MDYFKVLDTIQLYVLDTIVKGLGRVDVVMEDDTYMELMLESCPMLSMDLSGNSILVIKGNSNQQIYLLMGDNAQLNGFDYFLTSGGFVELHGSSMAEVYVSNNGILEGFLYDEALLKIKGNPYVDIKTEGNAHYIMVEK